jgi:hypothetical protein
MYKCLLIFILSVLCINAVYSKASGVDTSFFYYKFNLRGYESAGSRSTATRDSADYIRMIISPDSGKRLYNIKEVYMDGKLKLVGQAEPTGHIKENIIIFQGSCITFFTNGRRKSITNYFNGNRSDLEYSYYPTGKLYNVKKYFPNSLSTDVRYVECYDKNGNQIAKDGRGHWISYDGNFENIFIQGEIKNGRQEGEWTGSTMDSDSIKFSYVYKKGEFVSAKGIDKTGKIYPFKKTAEPAYYDGSFEAFRASLIRKIIIPKGADRGRLLNPLEIKFTISREGSITNLTITGTSDTTIATAALQFVKDNKNWKPRLYYGIPISSKITISLGEKNNYGSHGYWEEVEFGAKEQLAE